MNNSLEYETLATNQSLFYSNVPLCVYVSFV